MRITLPLSFWVALSLNLEYVDAFTPPHLWSPFVGGGGGRRENADRTNNPLTDDVNLFRPSPFYFATRLGAGKSDSNSNNTKFSQPEIDRARTQYLDWCSEYRKTPDDKRFLQFMENFLVMERMARKQGTQIKLNEYADYTAAEYQQKMKKRSGGSSSATSGGDGASASAAASAAQTNKNLSFVETSSDVVKKSPAGEAAAKAQVAAQAASEAVAAAKKEVVAATKPATPAPSAGDGSPAGTNVSVSDPAKILARQQAAEAERKRLELVAKAEAAQRAEAERARARATEAKAKRDAELAAKRAAAEKDRAEQERRKQEALAAQRAKMEEMERKRREAVARAEEAQRADAARARARAEKEEQERREREQALAAAARDKAEKEEAKRRKAQEEEDRLRKEREEAAAKARAAAEAAEQAIKRAKEELRLKKEQEESEAAEAKLKAAEAAEESRKKAEEEQRLQKEQEERKAAEAKRKAAALEQLAKERQVLLAKKKEQEEAAKRKLEEARLKQHRDAEAKREAAQADRRRLEQERKAKEVQTAAAAKAKAGLEATDRANRVTAAEEVAEKQQKENEQSISMSKGQSESKGKSMDVASIQSWWNSIRDVTSATNSRKRQRGGVLSSDDKNLDGKAPAVQARVKTIYLEWCQTYEKKPDDSRFPQFMERFLLIEQLTLEQDVEIALNEYADCTEEEYKKDAKRAESKASAPSSSQQSPPSDAKEDLVTKAQATADQEKKILEARAADLKKSSAQVSEDTAKLLTNLSTAQSKLQEMEQALADERNKEIANYQQQQKEVPTAEVKEKSVDETERLKEQRALAAKRKVEEENRKREELEAKQKAEAAAKKKADDEKRRQESIARARRKAEEEMRVKTAEADATAEKQAREEKRQNEIATKAKAAAAAAKKRQTEVAASTESKVKDPDDVIPDSEAMKELIDESEKSIDEQLAEVASRIEELQRKTNDVENDERAGDRTIAAKGAPDTETDGVYSSSKGDTIESDEADETRPLSKEEEMAAAEAKKKAEEEEELRIRSAYLDWCISFSKKPDMTRIKQFKQNYLLIEEYAKEKGTEIKLNEYADCTAAEYERAMKAKEEAKKKEDEEQRKREEEEAAAYKAAVGEVSDQFGIEGNKTAIPTDEPSDFKSAEDAVAGGHPDDVWKTGEPTMSMWEPESDESMWASEGGTSLWESDEWGEIDESYAAVGAVDPDDPEVRKRVRSAYSNWCKEYNKEPDEGRFPRFKSNYLKMEQVAWEQGREITLNEFADCSPEEYRLALDDVPMEEEERLERLRLEQEEEAKLAEARGREDRIERLRREQEEEAARLAAKRKVEPAWKIEAPKKRALENFRVDWEEDEKAALEEVERIALAKAEAAARRVEAARKKNTVENPNDRTKIRSNSIDVDRQLRQKALDERHKQEQAKLEEEFFAKAEAKQAEEDRLRREWEQTETEREIRAEEERQTRIEEDRQRKARMDASKAEAERRAADKSANELKHATAKPEPSPAFNLGSVFGTRKNGSSPLPPVQKGPGPGQPVVKPPGSFAPRVKKPAHGNSEWQQDEYVKSYDPTTGSGYDRNGVGDQSAVPPSHPPTDDSYFLDFSDGPGAQVSPPDMASPGNKEWYEENLSQSRVRPPTTESQRGSFSQGASMGSRPSSAEVAPDEVDLDASSRFKSYLDNLSATPKDRGASSQPSPIEDSQPYSSPPTPPTPAASPPNSRNGANYLENLQSQFPERIESAYRDWCQYYGKEASEDRLRIFATNFLAVEKYHRETGVSLILNELADMTSDEFKNGKGGP